MRAMRIALAQINPIVGDLAGNRTMMVDRLEEAKDSNADLALFPELAVTGYPPEDLLLRPGFVRAAEESLEQIAREARGIVAVVGTPHFDRDLYNAAAVCAGGEVKALVRKRFLPNYGVFDEFRYFAPGDGLTVFEYGETLFGVTICEDMWQPGPPATDLALAGAQLIVNISASPFHLLRDREREEMFRTRARDNATFVAFCNTVAAALTPMCDDLEQMRLALELGLNDYVRKNGFKEVVVGVSGGIDSALVAALAVEALGAGRVHCVSMPSRYSSEATRGDGQRLAENLGCDFREIAIEPMVEAFGNALAPSFA